MSLLLTDAKDIDDIVAGSGDVADVRRKSSVGMQDDVMMQSYRALRAPWTSAAVPVGMSPISSHTHLDAPREQKPRRRGLRLEFIVGHESMEKKPRWYGLTKLH